MDDGQGNGDRRTGTMKKGPIVVILGPVGGSQGKAKMTFNSAKDFLQKFPSQLHKGIMNYK
jgi:hypothetical protein